MKPFLPWIATGVIAVAAPGQTPAPKAAVCASPAMAAAADAMAARFEAHQFVFIGSTHGDLKIEEFLACLVTRPAFTQRATDIVTEWAGSGQQRLIDRYILDLEPISMEDLASIWFDTDAPTLWTTLPQVRQFVQTLRGVNATLQPARRVRLVGGNEGVDWTKVKTAEDLAPYPYKTNCVLHLLAEHLAKAPGNRTLVVYGDAHIRFEASTFMRDLEAAVGRKPLYVVGRIGELEEAERTYLAAAGDPSKPFFVDASRFPTGMPWPPSLRIRNEEKSPRLADYIDAFVYLGPEPDRSLIGAIPLTPAQQTELARRNAINSNPQQTMRARYQGRAQWFRGHPDDLVSRPRPKEAQFR